MDLSEKNTEECPHCGSSRLYRLGNGQYKCAVCRRKFGLHRRRRDRCLLRAFCDDLTALEASRECGCSYATAKHRYDLIRLRLVPFLEADYTAHTSEVGEFDEYFYLEASKKRSEKTVFEIQNFLTFDYGGKIYTILMPSLRKYRTHLEDDGMQREFYRQLLRFMTFRRIARLKELDNTIVAFWQFFEKHILRYRGVREENFIYYLKEAEFKFNFPRPHRRFEILSELMKEEKSFSRP